MVPSPFFNYLTPVKRSSGIKGEKDDDDEEELAANVETEVAVVVALVVVRPGV